MHTRMTNHEFQRPQILVVDDEEILLTMIKRALADLYRVVVACDGEAALRVLARPDQAVRMVLMDLTMPGMDGATLMARLRKDYPGLPLVVMTGLPEVVAAALLGGLKPEAYLFKPTKLKQLRQVLHHVLGPAA